MLSPSMKTLALALLPIGLAAMAVAAFRAAPAPQTHPAADSHWVAPGALDDISTQAGVREFTLTASPTRVGSSASVRATVKRW